MGPSKQEILSGFQVNWITLCDSDTGEIYWFGNEDYSSSESYFEIRLPKKTVKSRAISREMNFSSIEGWENFKIVHTMTYKGIVMEEIAFEFGPVAPNSKNIWYSTIEAAPEAKMMSLNILSGNVVLTTKYYNNESLITTSRARLFYD